MAEALSFVAHPASGAVVLFCGTVRDHAEGRSGVSQLHYEAYDEEVGPKLAAIAAEIHRRWPHVRRVVLLHRSGTMVVGEVSVVVVVSAPHRDDAFEAARFGIDTVKSTVPIWKRERWSEGEDWSRCDHPVSELSGTGS